MNLKIMLHGLTSFKELELGLEKSQALSDGPESQCELELGSKSEGSHMVEPETEVQTNPSAETVDAINVQEVEPVHEDGRFEDTDVLLFADTLLKII